MAVIGSFFVGVIVGIFIMSLLAMAGRNEAQL